MAAVFPSAPSPRGRDTLGSRSGSRSIEPPGNLQIRLFRLSSGPEAMAQRSSGLASGQALIQVRSVASVNARRVSTRAYAFTGRVLASGSFSFLVRAADDTYNLGASSPARPVVIS
jgi:hypothetical protein